MNFVFHPWLCVRCEHPGNYPAMPPSTNQRLQFRVCEAQSATKSALRLLLQLSVLTGVLAGGHGSSVDANLLAHPKGSWNWYRVQVLVGQVRNHAPRCKKLVFRSSIHMSWHCFGVHAYLRSINNGRTKHKDPTMVSGILLVLCLRTRM